MPGVGPTTSAVHNPHQMLSHHPQPHQHPAPYPHHQYGTNMNNNNGHLPLQPQLSHPMMMMMNHPHQNGGINHQPQPQPQPHKRQQDYETLCQIITQWNANRLDLFSLTLPNEDLEFNGVMRFYYQSQDSDHEGQKVATKCIRVSSTATTKVIIETLIEKFRPDMKMLEVPEYALYEIHESGERRLNPEEKPLLVQLNWHKDDREGRFLLRRIDEMSKIPEPTQEDSSFKRKLSKREKKQLKKQEKLNKLKEKENKDSSSGSQGNNGEGGMAEKLYNEFPDTSFTRSISNPEAVMRRRRQQKLEKKLQQFRSKDGGPDTGGTLKIYGESLCKDVPYKTLLLSVVDPAVYVVEEMLEKYGRNRQEAVNFCLVQVAVDGGGNVREYVLDDEECPLAILMNTPPNTINSTFHVRMRPPTNEMQRRRKKKSAMMNSEQQPDISKLPCLFETNPDGSDITNGLPQRFVIPPNVTEIGTDANAIGPGGQCLILSPGPGLFPKHCVLANIDGIVTITPNNRDAEVFVNHQRIFESTILQHGFLLQLSRGVKSFRFLDPHFVERERMRHFASSVTLPDNFELNSNSNYVQYGNNNNNNNPQQQQMNRGNDNILPAVLEFREETEEAFFDSITVSLDAGKVQFKLAPTYTIYMATRFRASTHYRPELIPEERAVRLTAMLNNVSDRLYGTVARSQHDAPKLAFWMANSSELLHFLKSDRHITSFSLQAQDVLADTVHLAFKQLVLCLQNDLKQAMPQMLATSEDDEIKGIMNVLSSAMNLLRKCRVNAALTIQLFSQLFHFINMWTFNQVILSNKAKGGVNFCTHRWGFRLKKRLNRIEVWAEKQGLELAADCHLARVVQAAHLLSARKNTPEDIASLSSICFKLNSLQLNTLLQKYEPDPNESPISLDMIDTIVRVAENTVDELTSSEGREVRLEEDFVLQLPFLLPEDGYSCDIVRGVPGGLVEFVNPLHQVGLCVLTPQPSSRGFWTIYMDRLDLTPMVGSPMPRSPSQNSQVTMNSEIINAPGPTPAMMQQQQQQPEVQLIKLVKSNNGMGLSIVAAKGSGKDKLGIYVKAVVEGGAAYHDGRLEAGDQLLKVDGHSLIGITQESAAEIMLKTGNIVELEVAKQGALYHGLATLLSQPSPVNSRSSSTMSQSRSIPSLHPQQQQQPQQQGGFSDQTYQNQNQVAFRGPPPPPQQQSRPPPQAAYNNNNRSNSVQNLTRPQQQPPHLNHFGGSSGRLPHPQMMEEHQGFYQNVGPSYPAPDPANPPPMHGRNKQVRLVEEEVFHASPRVAGTPQVSLNEGPEKPLRQHAYDQLSPEQLQQQITPTKGVQFQDSRPRRNSQQNNVQQSAPAQMNGNGQTANRVRFQEPERESNKNNDLKGSDNLPNHLEQLRINSNSVEREFRRRVAEYKKENESASDSEPPSNEIQTRLRQKRRELEEQQKAEKHLLEEAEKRRIESSSGSGDTPPPLPSVPPPPESPTQSSGTSGAASRLDMLVGVNKQDSNSNTPVKKVSFVTTTNHNKDKEDIDLSFEDDDEDEDNDNEKFMRLHWAEKDPNAFISDAESLLNSSSLALEKFDFNKSSTGHTPSVIGTQEIYRDPRQKMLAKAQEEKATSKSRDGAKLSFQEKMRLFAVEAGENATPRDKAKISKAQREIEDERRESSA